MAVTLFNEPLHRALNKIPIGAFVCSVILETLGYLLNLRSLIAASFYLLPIGLILAPIVAIIGIFDWRGLPERSEAGSKAFGHGWIMSAATLTFFYSWIIRYSDPSAPSLGSLGTSLFGFALLLLGAQRGGRLVTNYGISTRLEKFEMPPREYRAVDGTIHPLPNPANTKKAQGF